MSLRQRMLAIGTALALSIGAIAVAPAASAAPVPLAEAQAIILAQTNAQRAAAGLNPLLPLAGLNAAAQTCTQQQAAANRVAHCARYWDNYPAGWDHVRENVGAGYAVGDVVAGWMGATSQREAILDPRMTHLGVGYALSASGRPYFTQNFAAYGPLDDATFVDVNADAASVFFSAFASEIEWLAGTGVTTGYAIGESQRAYQPWIGVTRDAMAAFLYRTAGEPEFTAPEESPFVDVPVTHMFYKEISWLASEAISTGWTLDNGSQEFRPTLQITRDAMAAFLYRYYAPTPPELPEASPFLDVTPETSAFYTEIVWLSATAISTGWVVDGGVQFRPFATITRDAMAAFLYRADTNVIIYPGPEEPEVEEPIEVPGVEEPVEVPAVEVP